MASVVNGYFEFSFIVPKDIALNYGRGKLSYYAYSNSVDAIGLLDRDGLLRDHGFEPLVYPAGQGWPLWGNHLDGWILGVGILEHGKPGLGSGRWKCDSRSHELFPPAAPKRFRRGIDLHGSGSIEKLDRKN